jgi:hypothetical protein
VVVIVTLLDGHEPEPLPVLPDAPPDPPLLLEPQMPVVQARVTHSTAEAQLLPSGKPEPAAQLPLVHAPLAHWSFDMHIPPVGAP